MFEPIHIPYYVCNLEVFWFKICSVDVLSRSEGGVIDAVLPLISTQGNHYRGV